MFHKKNNFGFTLIEAVVVSVIVAILAAVAIPIYSGFIADQRVTTVSNLAETAAASANAYHRRTGTVLTGSILPNTTPLFLYFNGSAYTMTVNGDSIKVSETQSSPKIKSAAYK